MPKVIPALKISPTILHETVINESNKANTLIKTEFFIASEFYNTINLKDKTGPRTLKKVRFNPFTHFHGECFEFLNLFPGYLYLNIYPSLSV